MKWRELIAPTFNPVDWARKFKFGGEKNNAEILKKPRICKVN